MTKRKKTSLRKKRQGFKLSESKHEMWMKEESLIRCKEEALFEVEAEEVLLYPSNLNDQCLRTRLLLLQYLTLMMLWLIKNQDLNLDWSGVKPHLHENDQAIKILQEEALSKWINHSLKRGKKRCLYDCHSLLQENNLNSKLHLLHETHHHLEILLFNKLKLQNK